MKFAKNIQARTQNRNFARDQQAGIFPSHSSDEFQQWVVEAGFEILHFNNDHYRDPVTRIALDDLVVARKR